MLRAAHSAPARVAAHLARSAKNYEYLSKGFGMRLPSHRNSKPTLFPDVCQYGTGHNAEYVFRELHNDHSRISYIGFYYIWRSYIGEICHDGNYGRLKSNLDPCG